VGISWLDIARSSLVGYDGNLLVAEKPPYSRLDASATRKLHPEEATRMTVEIHEQTIEAPPDDVWGFMVDPAALSVWFGADAWLEPETDGRVSFRFADGSVRRGVVEQVERSRRLTWRWREHRGAGFSLEVGDASRVTIELEPLAGGTLVRITETPAIVGSRGAA
jgi:uncharacterized protein YndB with AHSA1/START domain